MPKAPSSPVKAKAEPYEKTSPKKQSSVKSDPDDNASSGNEKASPSKKGGKGTKGVSWTADMDQELMIYVLSISDINLRYNWPELQRLKFPDLTPKQVSTTEIDKLMLLFPYSIFAVSELKSRWDNKLKNAMFPPEVMKMNKEAKGGKAGAARGDAEAEADD
jgi:hypothetical protein